MALTSGTRLGPYQIATQIGAGGMGEVYRARDTRLDRIVAVKILPAALAADPVFRERFDREARAISQLTHPNICTLYDVGQQAGTAFLVMELLDGETLTDRLRKGALPLDEALKIAIQIADALSTAHRHGIVHRDLKPGNIMLTKAGAKLLDFGLAKGSGATPAGAGLSMVPTTPANLTAQGTILGTFQYMAPEQLEGQDADARTDIFAFGAVLYEMMTGTKAFEGKSQASLIGAILHTIPQSIAALQPLAPASLDRIVGTCLAKDPDDRWQSARDVQRQLEWINQRDNASSITVDGSGPRNRLVWITPLIVVAIVAIAIATLWPRRDSKTEPAVSERFEIVLPRDLPLASVAVLMDGADKAVLALSLDGAHLAYVAQVGNHTQIAVRDMTSGTITSLAGSDNAYVPFFSPDGASIAFFADGKLKTLPVGGGLPTTLADASNGQDGVWSPEGVIYFNQNEAMGLFRVSATGGPVEQVSKPGSPIPRIFLLGRSLSASTPGASQATDLGLVRESLKGGVSARFVSTGHVVYAMPGRLVAAPFDRLQLRALGTPITLAADLRTAPYGVGQFAVSGRGTLIYASGRDQSVGSFVWVDRAGGVQPVGLPEGWYPGAFSVSPDGGRLAVQLPSDSAQGGMDIWLYDIVRRTPPLRLTPRVPDGRVVRNTWPRWTRDGKHILYMRAEESHGDLMRVSADRLDDAHTLWSRTADGPEFLYPTSFSADGAVLAAFGLTPLGGYGLYTMPLPDLAASLETHPVPQLWRKSPFNQAFPEFSPRGDAIAYQSDESGRVEIYVSPYPGPGPRCQVSNGGGLDASWTPEGRAILFRQGVSIAAVDVTSVPRCEIGAPRMLFNGAFSDRAGYGHDITADGRLLMIENKSILQAAPTLKVITNIFDELRRRAPLKE